MYSFRVSSLEQQTIIALRACCESVPIIGQLLILDIHVYFTDTIIVTLYYFTPVIILKEQEVRHNLAIKAQNMWSLWTKWKCWVWQQHNGTQPLSIPYHLRKEFCILVKTCSSQCNMIWMLNHYGYPIF